MSDVSFAATATASRPATAAPSHRADAPVALRALLTGPRAPGRILAVFPHAVYVAVDGSPDVVAVVTGDGVRLPNALVIPAQAAEAPFLGVAPGAPAHVGAGGVAGGRALRVRVGRWSDRRVRVAATDRGTVRAGGARVAAALHGSPVADIGLLAGRDRLVAALTAGDASAARAAADALIGRGAGLTPAGDDVLAGVLAAGGVLAGALGADATAAALADLGRYTTPRAATRTTALSVALLRHACRGEMAAPAAAVVRAVAAGSDTAGPVARLLTVGHSSGHDLALGIAAAAAAVATTTPPTAPGDRR